MPPGLAARIAAAEAATTTPTIRKRSRGRTPAVMLADRIRR
jgi:hypothetical protein